jgi:molybdopterin biosynthesis enzyme
MANKFTLSAELARGIYCAGNSLFWHNMLPQARILIVPALSGNTWAQWSCGDYWKYSTIRIASDATQWHMGKLVSVILHEQIHVAQMRHHLARVRREQHGEFFQFHHRRILGTVYVDAYT